MPVISRFGHNILCDGHVMGGLCEICNQMKINIFLCDGHVMETEKSN